MRVHLHCLVEHFSVALIEKSPHYFIFQVFDFCKRKNGRIFDSKASLVDSCTCILSDENRHLTVCDSAVDTCLRQLTVMGAISIEKLT